MNTQNNTVLITGGGSGIGFAIAKQFSEQGNKVIIAARNAERLNKAASQLKNVTAIPCDLTNEADVDRLVAHISANGGLDILVNNSGTAFAYTLGKDANVYDKAKLEIEINYLSTVRLTEKLLPLLRQKPEAAIINVTSIVTFAPWAVMPTYSASKAALQSYTLLLRLALRDTKIHVIEVQPPLVDTDMASAIPAPKIPPADIAVAVLEGLANNAEEVRPGNTANLYQAFLQSPRSAFNYINGVN